MRLDGIVQAEVDKLGKRCEVVMGSKHVKILVDGVLAATVPAKPIAADRRASLNVRGSIRRVAAGVLPERLTHS